MLNVKHGVRRLKTEAPRAQSNRLAEGCHPELSGQSTLSGLIVSRTTELERP